VSESPNHDFVTAWQKVARRIRVPLGFFSAIVYIFVLSRHQPGLRLILWSLLLTVPGLWLRGYAAGYVKKNRELTVTGPYAWTRNPLYLGSMLIAGGFAVALGSWPVAVLLVFGFLLIYIPVILSEERFLRANFAGFDDYCKQVPRLIGLRHAAKSKDAEQGGFSIELYLKHREYRAALGVTLLYACLIFLAPFLGALWNGKN
jgi:protein-S-isoprenylcysteine O-methyltransferase Ste14